MIKVEESKVTLEGTPIMLLAEVGMIIEGIMDSGVNNFGAKAATDVVDALAVIAAIALKNIAKKYDFTEEIETHLKEKAEEEVDNG